jgi:NDP-sugar pyrophosphorylase family protein
MGSGLSGAIIAAGRGERLRTAVAGVPKPLVKLGGETLLARQVREMRAAGLDPVHVIVNSETARMMRGEESGPPDEIDLLVRDTANSMESLLALSARIKPGRFALATVDAVLGPGRLEDFLRRALAAMDSPESRFDGALGVVRWRGDKHPLFAQVAADGLITCLGEKRTDIVTAGVYLLASRVFDYSDEARRLGLNALRQFLGLLIDRGTRLAAVEIDQVIDVDEGADLGAAGAMLAGRPGGK